MFKKPKFIRKYDFIHYFTRSRDEWFWSANMLEAQIKSKIDQYTKTLDLLEDEFMVDDIVDTTKYDALKDLDNDAIRNSTDPKIIEGNLVDQLAKIYIQKCYPDCSVHDFDSLSNCSLEEKFAKTCQILKDSENIILFQPVFIYKNIAIAKPDVLIKRKGIFILIEVKGTTKPKYAYLVDIAYQWRIINDVLSHLIQKKIIDCKLCLIAYEKLLKHKVSFVLTDNIFLTKSSVLSAEQNKNIALCLKYSDIYYELVQNAYIHPESTLKINELLCLDVRKKLKQKQLISYDKYIYPLLSDEFDEILKTLKEHEIIFSPQFLPVSQYKSWLREHEFWKLIHTYYYLSQQYFSMGYSGKLINYTNALDIYRDQTLSSMAQCIQLSRYQTKLKKITNYFENLNGMHSYVRFAHGVYLPRAIKIFKDLKPKRVFYDFESVMLASRIFDHTPPFLQTVVQVSIIVEEFGEIKRTRDIVIDPKNFTINDFKTIIDAVDCGDDYSYVVYNKAFENTQLKNMNIFIDDPIYTKKINTITADANCFDLMDFFNVDKQLIIIEKLKGHYSIKDVLRFINEYYPEFLAQSNSVSYTNLNIHNGVEATNTFALRFLGYIDDSTWESKVIDLKKYCQNDVKAMIAVVLLLELILKQK